MNFLRFAVLIGVVRSVPVIVPDDEDGEWKKVPPNYRYCPLLRSDYVSGAYQHYTVDFHLIDTVSDKPARGFLCHISEYSSHCDFRWYGPKYRSQKITRLTPNPQECMDKLRQKETGRHDWVGFPAFSCNYASVTTSKNKEVVLVPHHVKIDDYENGFVDPAFPRGVCRDSTCDTIYEDTLWLSEKLLSKQSPPACNLKMVKHSGTLYVPQGEGERKLQYIQLTGDVIPTLGLGESCSMELCGKRGIRLPHGLWIGIDHEAGKLGGRSIVNLESIPKCAAKLTASAVGDRHQELRATWDTARVFEYALCQSTWDKLERKLRVSPLDLSYLNPTSPGPGLGFMMINGSLMMSQLTFKRLFITSRTNGEIKLNEGPGKSIKWKRWEPHGSLLLGPNGMIKAGNTVKLPFYILGIGSIDEDISKAEEGNIIPHHEIKKDFSLHPVVDRYGWKPEGESGDLVKSFSDSFGSLFHIGFLFWVIPVLAGVLGVLFVIKCLLGMRKKGSRSTSLPQGRASRVEIPLSDF